MMALLAAEQLNTSRVLADLDNKSFLLHNINAIIQKVQSYFEKSNVRCKYILTSSIV